MMIDTGVTKSTKSQLTHMHAHLDGLGDGGDVLGNTCNGVWREHAQLTHVLEESRLELSR